MDNALLELAKSFLYDVEFISLTRGQVPARGVERGKITFQMKPTGVTGEDVEDTAGDSSVYYVTAVHIKRFCPPSVSCHPGEPRSVPRGRLRCMATTFSWPLLQLHFRRRGLSLHIPGIHLCAIPPSPLKPITPNGPAPNPQRPRDLRSPSSIIVA